MEKFIAGVDADGVLTDMAAFNMEEGRKFYKRNPVFLDGYSAREIFVGTKFQEVLFGLKVFEKYCVKTPLRPGTQRVIRWLHEEGVELHEITARKFVTLNNPIGAHYRKLLKQYFDKHQLPFKSIQYCSEEFSPRDKYIACSKLGVDVMIEDKPEVALYLASRGIPVILFDAPYNQNIAHENMVRVHSWDECYEQVHILRDKKKKVPEYKPLSKEEKIALTGEERATYIDSYRNYIKNLKVNTDAFRKSERRFKLLYRIGRIPFKIAFRAKVEGLENVPYQNGFIIASNHLDSMDQFYISNAIGERRFCGFAASTIENTIRGRLFKFIGGAVFIDRTDAASKSAGEEELTQKIMHDQIALIFPEGTRKNKNKEGEGILQLPFRLGTVSIAQKTGAPILPVSIYHGKRSYVKISQVQVIKKTDDLVKANERLERTISSMTLRSMDEDKPKQYTL